MNKEYSWAVGSYYQKYDVNEVGKELSQIEQKSELTAENVVDYARNESSYMHQMFEWDDAIAGEKYRQQIASSIIGAVKVEVISEDEDGGEKKIQTRAFVTIGTNKRKSTFKNIFAVADDSSQYALLLECAYKELNAIRKKYEELIEIQELLKDIPVD